MRIFAITIGLLLSSGCGATVIHAPVGTGGTEGASGDVALTPITYQGQVRYEARMISPTGASAARDLRPARRVRLRFIGPDGEVARAETDGEGRFEAQVPDTTTILEVDALIEYDQHDLWVAGDRPGEQVYTFSATLEDSASPMDIRITDDDPGYAGAFHILDRMLDGSLAVREWTGRTLPGFFAFWGRGVTTDWSYYHGACGAEADDHYCIELLGGDPGQQATTDTDEHDDAIILHEFGHFVMDQLSTSSSHGGSHPGGFLIDPGLAWEEARASWFALAVLNAPLYQDTIGIEGTGSLRVNYDAERRGHGPRGQGSELGVLEILWDLNDGGPGSDDQDADGAALGPGPILRAMIDMRELPGAYPSVSSFLAFLVERGELTPEALERVLAVGAHPAGLAGGEAVAGWPRDLRFGEWVGGKIDGVTDPAPSGGPPRPMNGYDAVHVFRVHLEESGLLNVHLEISGQGTQQTQSDLDLELRDFRGDELAASRGETPQEAITMALDPGYYLIYVRDGGNGNRVPYRMRVTTGW